MTSPYAELINDGSLGPHGVALLYRTVAAVARFDRYPPPEHYQTWTQDAITEVAHDFLAGPRAPERLLQLALTADDDESFARVLEATVRNFFRSRARATERGKLYRRVRALLDSDESFVAAPDSTTERWALSDGPTEPWQGSIDDLLVAAATVAVPLVDAERSRRDAVRAICERLLATAGGSVATQDVVGVVAWRLGLTSPPLTIDVDAADPGAALDVASESVAALDADATFTHLTDRERLLLLVLDEPVREAAQFVGVSKSTAAEAANRLRHKLQTLLPDPDNRLEILRQLSLRAAQWAEGRTDSPPPAS